MGEKFGPNQRIEDNEASTHERAEVLSPLNQAFLNHVLSQVEDPAERVRLEPRYRQMIADLSQEELDRHLGIREAKRDVLGRLAQNKYFKTGLLAVNVTLGTLIAYNVGHEAELRSVDEMVEVIPPEKLFSDAPDLDPSDLESHEPNYVEFERLDPTMSPERMRQLFLTLPQGFVDEVKYFGYRSDEGNLPDDYGLDDWTELAVTEKDADHPRVSIFFYSASAKNNRLTDIEGWFGTAVHETFHANDDLYSSSMSVANRRELRQRLNERVISPNRFRSDYVESINIPAKVEPDPLKREERRLNLKSTEYLAELGEAYLMSADPEKEFTSEDLALVRWFIGLKDPHFDQKAARAQHRKILGEMQDLRESWQQSKMNMSQNEAMSIVRGLPVSADEREYFQRRLSGLRTSATENASFDNQGIKDQTLRADLIEVLQRWGTTEARRSWAWLVFQVYDEIEDLRRGLGQPDYNRESALALAETLSKVSSWANKTPEGTTKEETEIFRSEVLAIFAAHAGPPSVKLGPGEFTEMLDWSAENPAWAVHAAGFEVAKADLNLENEILTRNQALRDTQLDDHEDKM
jgi:hypothetical protein